jgi:hypothetical protein
VKFVSGHVVSGKVVLDGDGFPDGTHVIVIADAEPDTFDLAPEEEAELLESIREADRGHLVDAWQSLRDLECEP